MAAVAIPVGSGCRGPGPIRMRPVRKGRDFPAAAPCWDEVGLRDMSALFDSEVSPAAPCRNKSYLSEEARGVWS